MCLPIISNKAGLEESKDISIVLKENTSKELLKVLLKITSNEKYRRLKQNEVYRNNKFTIDKISKKLDNLRDKVFYNNKNTKIKKTKKYYILLISTKMQMEDFFILFPINLIMD